MFHKPEGSGLGPLTASLQHKARRNMMRYISSLSTLLSFKLCVIAGLKCYFCWIHKTLLFLQIYFFTPLKLVSNSRFLCFVSRVQRSLISSGLILPCFAQLSAPNVFASCLLLLQPCFKCPFQEEKPACMGFSKKKRLF